MSLFHERQYFDQWWIRGAVLGGAAVVWWAAWRQLVRGEPVGTNPAGDTLLLLFWLLIGVGLPALFLTAHLRTEVTRDGIRIRLTPLHRRWREWAWARIRRLHPRTYSPIKEYGGWGIRMGPRGWAYNVKGNQGIQMELDDGSRVLIGTGHPEEFMAAVREARPRGVELSG